MYSWDNPDDRVAIVNLNSELRHAQLELLSAHCSIHQLRLRFSAEDLARFGQRDVLRKSVQAATAISEYYLSIEKKIPAVEAGAEQVAAPSEETILEFVEHVSTYLTEERTRHLRSAVPS